MTISDLQNYTLSFLPPMTWFTRESEEVVTLLLASFAGFSMIFLLLVVLANHTSLERYRKFTGYTPFVYMVAVYFIAFNLSTQSNNLPASPLFLLAALLMVLTSFVVLAAANRIRTDQMPWQQIPFLDFCKINVWLSLLLSGPLLLPFLLFQIPTFNHQQQLFYLGAVLLMVGLYLLITRFFFKHLTAFLGLAVPLDKLPSTLKARFDEACAPILAVSDCEIVVARRGLYNAVAQPGLKRITVGLSLIEFLSVEQLRAVLTHELGHLEDRVYQPRINRFQQLGAFSFLLYAIVTDSRIDYAIIYGGFFILLTFYFLLIAPKKPRLNGEKVADSYVMKTDPKLYEHLQAALPKIYFLNGLHKDHCKKHDADHLDLDERQEAVATGKIKKRHTFTRRTAFLLLILLVLVGLVASYAFYS